MALQQIRWYGRATRESVLSFFIAPLNALFSVTSFELKRKKMAVQEDAFKDAIKLVESYISCVFLFFYHCS